MKRPAFSRASSVAFCGLAIALLSVGAWVTIPFGPVPFTLQTMVLTFVVLLFPAREALISVFGYLALGAIGVPVFSGMHGGLASILGPTGGFIAGFGLGSAAAILLLKLWKEPGFGPGASRSARAMGIMRDVTAGLVLLAVSYVCGLLQLMAVAGLDPYAAFLAGVAPFVVIDVVKAVVGASLARTVRHAVPALRAKRP